MLHQLLRFRIFIFYYLLLFYLNKKYCTGRSADPITTTDNPNTQNIFVSIINLDWKSKDYYTL